MLVKASTDFLCAASVQYAGVGQHLDYLKEHEPMSPQLATPHLPCIPANRPCPEVSVASSEVACCMGRERGYPQGEHWIWRYVRSRGWLDNDRRNLIPRRRMFLRDSPPDGNGCDKNGIPNRCPTGGMRYVPDARGTRPISCRSPLFPGVRMRTDVK